MLRHVTTAALATSCRVVGVVVALVGVAIAAPDGTALIWRRVRSWLRWLRGMLARFLPFQRTSVSVNPSAATGTVYLGGGARSRAWQPWEPDADDARKIEILRRQIELLEKEIDRVWTRQQEQLRERRREDHGGDARVSA